MQNGNSVPQLKAAQNILPYSLVKLSTTVPFAVEVCDSEFFAICGVVDGSVSSSNGTYHALVGEPVSLQSGMVVMLRVDVSSDEDQQFPQALKGAPLFPRIDGNGSVTPNPWSHLPNRPLVENFQYVALEHQSPIEEGFLIPAIKSQDFNRYTF
jgi:hypothetical protein